jgi:AraC family transcriptional regulator
VLEGSIDKAFPRSECYSPASTAITMPAQERHKDRFERAGAHMLVLEPDPAAEELFHPCARALERISHFRDGAIVALAWRISAELRWPDAVSYLAVEGLALEMLAVAARRTGQVRPERRPPPWLSTVREMLHASFAEPLRASELAAQVGVHPVLLARVFREHTGESLGHYVRRLRLDWATAQLTTSDIPLSDLALRAGFTDQSHFTRAFKEHTGLTPAQYRQLAQRG